MKKSKIFAVGILIISLLLVACTQNNNTNEKEPDVLQVRSICELATLECYYHNVAKSKKAADSWFKTDREFWIEYTGIAKIGINMSDVDMEISGNNVTVTLPEAELLDINICESDLNENSYIKSPDNWLIKNKISADDQTAAIYAAQMEMAESVKNNKTLLLNAQARAQELIENYIRKIGEISGTEYQIKWVYDNSVKTNTEDNNGDNI